MKPYAAVLQFAFLRRLVASAFVASLAASAAAIECPDDEPTSIGGRVVVWEQNLEPPAFRGVGEVYVYAHPADGVKDVRRVAVSDPDGNFCIRGTPAGEWLVVSTEPFHFRPFVRALDCQPGACDVGEIELDASTLRISDDYIGYGHDWWGGPKAQTVTMPDDAVSINRITFRSAGESSVEINVYEGETLTEDLIGRDQIHFPDNATGTRESAHFAPGEVVVEAGDLYTVHFNGSGGVWRMPYDGYDGGQMFEASGGALHPIAGQHLCMTIDVDGPDGNLTSFLRSGNDGWVVGERVAQAFVARSASITYASVVIGTPGTEPRTIRASIGETPDGPPIGLVRQTWALPQEAAAFAWEAGTVPVTVGGTYWVRFDFPEGGQAVYRHSHNPAGTEIWVDGQLEAGGIWGRVMGPAPEPEEEAPDPEPSGIDGVVFDDSIGPSSPIAGAHVAIDGVEATTGLDGAFSLDVPPGASTLAVEAAGFETFEAPVSVLERGRISMEIALTPAGSNDDQDDPGDTPGPTPEEDEGSPGGDDLGGCTCTRASGTGAPALTVLVALLLLGTRRPGGRG